MTEPGLLLLEKYRAHLLPPARDARIDSFSRVGGLRCMLIRQLDNHCMFVRLR